MHLASSLINHGLWLLKIYDTCNAGPVTTIFNSTIKLGMKLKHSKYGFFTEKQEEKAVGKLQAISSDLISMKGLKKHFERGNI